MSEFKLVTFLGRPSSSIGYSSNVRFVDPVIVPPVNALPVYPVITYSVFVPCIVSYMSPA